MSRLPAIRSAQHLSSRLGSSIFPRSSPRTLGFSAPVFIVLPIGKVFDFSHDNINTNGTSLWPVVILVGIPLVVLGAQYAVNWYRRKYQTSGGTQNSNNSQESEVL